MAVRVINHTSVSVSKPAAKHLKRIAYAYGMKMHNTFDMVLGAFTAMNDRQREEAYQRFVQSRRPARETALA